MATNDSNMKGLKTELDYLKSATQEFIDSQASYRTLKSLHAGVTTNKELYRSSGFDMDGYAAIVGDADRAIKDAERGKYGKWLPLGVAGALAIGAIGGYGIPGLFKPSEPDTPAATRYEGDFAELKSKNTTLSFRTGNGKSSFALKGTQESGEFAAASRKTRGNAKIHIDTRGELSFNLSDPNDPNDMNLDFWGDRNGAHAVFNGTQKGDYKATIKNKGPPKCRNNLR